MSEIPPAVPTTKKSGLAVSSLVLGIMSLVMCAIGSLFGIPAVICGHMAHSRIKRSGGQLTGRGLATGGLVMGYISLALIPVMALMLAIAIPNFIKAREAAMQNAQRTPDDREKCSQNIDQIDNGKALWASDTGKTNGTPTAAELDKYIPGGFDSLKCPKGGQYSINPIDTMPTCSEPSHKPKP